MVLVSAPQFLHCGTRRDGSAILVFPDDPSLATWPAVEGAPDGPGPDLDRGLSPAAAQLAERRARLTGGASDEPRREVLWDEIQARTLPSLAHPPLLTAACPAPVRRQS